MAKVLLLQPPVSFKEKAFALVPDCPHLGLLYLAGTLRREGFEVVYLDIADNSFSPEDVEGLIVKERFDILGITAMTQNIKGAVQLAKFLKERRSPVRIVLGGPHLSADPTLPQRFPFFDSGVTGEADLTFSKVATDLLNGKRHAAVVAGQTPMDLDALPFPARDLVDHAVYKKRGYWANGIFSTRGCPCHCNFCSIPAIDKRVRYRSPRLVAQEMKECAALTRIRRFVFSDDALTINKKFVYELCDEISRLPLRIQWEAQSRVNYVDQPILKAMKKAGCTKLLFGIESGNERIRNEVIGKGVTDDEILKVTRLCWKEGIEPDHYLMIGQPSETEKEIMDTVTCPLRFKPNIIGVFITMPLPGSPLFDQAVKEGIIEKDTIDRYIRGEFGEGYQGCWPYYIPKGLTLDYLLKMRSLALRKFYMRPGYISRRVLVDFTSWVRIKRDIREGLSLLFKNRSASDYNVLKKKCP